MTIQSNKFSFNEMKNNDSISIPSLSKQISIQAPGQEFWYDPVTQEILTDPYSAQCGHTYNKDTFEMIAVDAKKKNIPTRCSLCREVIDTSIKIKNYFAREAMAKMLDDAKKITTLKAELNSQERKNIEELAYSRGRTDKIDSQNKVLTEENKKLHAERKNLGNENRALSKQVEVLKKQKPRPSYSYGGSCDCDEKVENLRDKISTKAKLVGVVDRFWYFVSSNNVPDLIEGSKKS
jgi:hypothetical protein